MIEEILNNWLQYVIFGSLLAGSFIVGFLLHYLIVLLIKLFTRKTETNIDNIIVRHMKGPLKLLLPVVLFNLVLPYVHINKQAMDVIRELFIILFIIAFAWILTKVTSILTDSMKQRYRVDVKDNLHARKIQTQMQVLKRIVSIIIYIITIAVILMRFEAIRQLGTTLLASAGIVGLILGFAAQKTLSTLVAGFQLAFTQPIRIDDVVIVENEWGRIEEITLTYVVVKIWDLRRLVVPITYFIDHPFQNWTRVSAEIIGTVYLYCDYTIPLEAVRRKLREVCEASEIWDKKVCVLQVTAAKEKTVELRALVSAADAGQCWDLRCNVREKLLDFIQKEYGGHLPKVRAFLEKSEFQKGISGEHT
ncbi:MAG: mechanosensitive ion channel [Spirochaetia bacterium]